MLQQTTTPHHRHGYCRLNLGGVGQLMNRAPSHCLFPVAEPVRHNGQRLFPRTVL